MDDEVLKEARQHIAELRRSITESAFPKPDYSPAMMKPFVPPGDAELAIKAIAKEIEEWKANTPDGKHLVVLLGTPDGGVMDVEYFQVGGRNVYRATGYLKGEPNMVVGHVATLAFRGFYEDNAKGGRVGFKSFIEPQSESEPIQSSNT